MKRVLKSVFVGAGLLIYAAAAQYQPLLRPAFAQSGDQLAACAEERRVLDLLAGDLQRQRRDSEFQVARERQKIERELNALRAENEQLKKALAAPREGEKK